MSDMQDRITACTTALVFFSLEFNRIPEARYRSIFGADADLVRYSPVFDRMRAMAPYQLSDELERFVHDQSVVGASAWAALLGEEAQRSAGECWVPRTHLFPTRE